MAKLRKTKQNFKRNPPKDPLGHQIWFKTKEEGVGLPCVSFKNQSNGRGREDRSEPSPRFASNGIHMKKGDNNLLGNDLRRSPGVSQVSIQRGNLKTRSHEEEFLKNTLSNSLEHSSREE